MKKGSELRNFDAVRAVEKAYGRIRAGIVRTPVTESAVLGRLAEARVLVKWENLQTTGSFKLRGALNKVRSLSPAERKRGLVAASTGNHGLGVAHAARRDGLGLVLFLPKTASPEKVAKLMTTGTDIRFYGTSCEQAEVKARRFARAEEMAYVAPYNDLEVIAGQGTLGLEILEDVPDVTDIVAAVGGGGLIGGIAAYARARKPGVRVIGVEPAASAFMKASIAAGRLVSIDEGPTLADAVAGGMEPGSVTFPICRDLLDGILTVGEERLREAVRLLFREHGQVVEGAGALPAAGLIKHASRFRGRTVVLVASGGNISPGLFARTVGTDPRSS